MKLHLNYNKKNNYIIAGIAAGALFLYYLSRYPLPLFFVFCGVFYLLLNIKIELYDKIPWVWTVIILFFGSIFTMLCVQHVILDAETYALTKTNILRLNVVAVAVVYMICMIIMAKPSRAMILAHSVLVSLAFVDYFVYQFRQNEFTVSDFSSIGTGISVAGNYDLAIHDRGGIVILLSAMVFFLLCKLGVKFKKTWPVRLISIGPLVILLMYLAVKTENMETQTWELKAARQNGYILNFMLEIRDMHVSAPDGYSTEAIEALEAQYGGDSTASDSSAGSDSAADSGTDGALNTDSSTSQSDFTASAVLEEGEKPTIIAIMDESFADLSVLGDLTTNQEVMPFISSLTENTTRGYALASVFGAKTPNSEWEFLTGNTMAFLPEGSVVYQQYLSSTPTSLVSNLKNEGYVTVGMHPYLQAGWRRNTVYPKLGFDETYFLDDGSDFFDETAIIREYVTDEEMFNKMIERFESRDTDSPLFMFGVTMQNHGGYTDEYANFDEEVSYGSDVLYDDVNQFLSLARETDRAVEQLISYFSEVDEPVEIVFFGDHQPSLSNYFYKQMNGTGMSGLTMDELETFYEVPFFVWTNYDTEEIDVGTTSLNYLSTLMYEKSGLELPAYNKFLQDLMEVIPSMNARGYYSETYGRYIHYEDASGEESEWLNQYEILQYNNMFDKKNKSSVFFPYIMEDSAEAG